MFKYVLFTAAGFAMGYYVAQTRLEEGFEVRLDREVQEAKYHYRDFYKKRSKDAGEPEEFTGAALDASEAMDEYAGITVGPDILTQEVSATVKRAVDRGDLEADDSWDQSKKEHDEEKVTFSASTISAPKPPKVNYNRFSTPEKPVEEVVAESPEPVKPEQSDDDMKVDVITKKAFIDNQFGYEQFSFTYFAGDDVLANEEDEKVTGKARYSGIGLETLDKLKAGPTAMDGEDVIYVRNHSGKWEFEVTRSEGKYSDEVQK